MRRTPAVLLLLAIACTDSKQPAPPPDPQADARARLSVLARATAEGAYDATYRFVQRPSNATGTIRLRQAPPEYRIDVTSKGTASFFSLNRGTISCAVKGRATTCFMVAKPGEEVPPLFDPGVQRLFRDAVEELAANPTHYRVTEVEPTAPPAATFPAPSATATPSVTTGATGPTGASGPTGPVPVGTCFAVERVDAASPSPGTVAAGFENGTYCFAEQGVATRIEVASGVLELVALGGEPHSTWFSIPAKVQQLPALSPSPTAKPTPTR